MILSNSRSSLDDFFNNLNTHPVPLEFSKSLTTGERLDAIYNLITEYLDKYNEFGSDVKAQIEQALNLKYEEIEKLMSTLVDSKLPNDALIERLKKILFDTVAESFNYITFGLEDGYFTAYIPTQWKLMFNTDVTPDSENYGKLEINY